MSEAHEWIRVPIGSDVSVIVVPIEMIARLRQLAIIAGDPGAELATIVGTLIRTADAALDLSSVVHPWGEPHSTSGVLHSEDCEMCWAGDGDVRCTRCGRSTGGSDACECGDQRRVGPCAVNQPGGDSDD